MTLSIPLLQSRIVLLKQLREQGYDTSEYETDNIALITTMVETKQLDMLLENKTSEKKKKVYIHYYLNEMVEASYNLTGKKPQAPKKVSLKSEIPKIIDDLFITEEVLAKSDNLIIIVDCPITEGIEGMLEMQYNEHGYFIILFDIKNLQYDITDHTLYFPHRVLSETETSEVMTLYNITSKDQFPDISRFDACAKVIGIRPGEVCEITRSSKTAITSLYYRICVN
jgi:DNA-directed RNA polymerase subunit H (RpoH/RPB5)